MLNIQDPYLSYSNSLGRLIKEYEKYKKIIVAYDFDGTINDFHKDGSTYEEVMKLLRDLKPYASFICFTASKEERYTEIRNHIKDHNIPLDTINESIPGTPQGVKVYYNILLDDRAGLRECYELLKDLLKHIKENER